MSIKNKNNYRRTAMFNIRHNSWCFILIIRKTLILLTDLLSVHENVLVNVTIADIVCDGEFFNPDGTEICYISSKPFVEPLIRGSGIEDWPKELYF